MYVSYWNLFIACLAFLLSFLSAGDLFANVGNCEEVYLEFVKEQEVKTLKRNVFLRRVYRDLTENDQNPEVTREQLEKLFERPDPNKFMLFAQLEGKIVGVMAFHIDKYEHDESGNRAFLYYLAVHPDFRERGIGRAMVHQDKDKPSSAEPNRGLIAWSEIGEVTRIVTKVRMSNKDAKTFLERIGFKKAHTETPSFSNPTEAAQWYEYTFGPEEVVVKESPTTGPKFTDPADRAIIHLQLDGPNIKLGTQEIRPQRREPPEPSKN